MAAKSERSGRSNRSHRSGRSGRTPTRARQLAGLGSLLLIGVVASACANTASLYKINVDSISQPGAPVLRTYVLRSGMPEVSTDDLQFREYATYIERALLEQGYMLIDDEKTADLAIEARYGIGLVNAREANFAMPVFGTAASEQAVIYSRNQNTRVMTYFRYLILDATDLHRVRDGEKDVAVWRTVATSSGSSSDLRRVLPVMVSAASPYLGSDTGRQVHVSLTENDEAVKRIRGEL